MKKIFAAMLVVAMMASMLIFNTSATETTVAKLEWLITEICTETDGTDSNTAYTDSENACLFMEIVNSSDKELDLYKYCITWHEKKRGGSDFEGYIEEVTPIKAGNFHDQSTCAFDYKNKGEYVGAGCENCPKNPETCLVAPGEVVVLWFWYDASALTAYNNGKGLSVADFRQFWNIPENVKVIVVDGMEDTDVGGHEKNFTLWNKKVCTYGICEYDEEFLKSTNVTDGYAGIEKPYAEIDIIKSWATLDFNMFPDGGVKNKNYTYNFTYDFSGITPSDKNVESGSGYSKVVDNRRMILVDYYSKGTPGTLTTLQKLSLGVALEAGESFELASPDYTLYVPSVEGATFEGFVINDVLYKVATTENAKVTFADAGVYTIDYKFSNDGKTVTETVDLTKDGVTVTLPAAPETTEPAPETTEPALETTESAPETTEPGASGNTGDSAVVFAAIALITLAGVVVVSKRREN